MVAKEFFVSYHNINPVWVCINPSKKSTVPYWYISQKKVLVKVPGIL